MEGQGASAGASLSVGSALKPDGAEFRGQLVSLALFTSPKCHYCLESKSFRKRLVAEARLVHVPFFVAVPQRRKATDYLSDLGIMETAVREWKDFNVHAAGTPTVVGVDSSGTAKRVWLGVVRPEREIEATFK
jgi:hypothetical protein